MHVRYGILAWIARSEALSANRQERFCLTDFGRSDHAVEANQSSWPDEGDAEMAYAIIEDDVVTELHPNKVNAQHAMNNRIDWFERRGFLRDDDMSIDGFILHSLYLPGRDEDDEVYLHLFEVDDEHVKIGDVKIGDFHEDVVDLYQS